MFSQEWNAAQEMTQGLHRYKFGRWTQYDIFELFMAAKGLCSISPNISSLTTLQDPDTQAPLSILEVIASARALEYFKSYPVEKIDPKPLITKWPRTDDDAVKMFGIRTKSDLAVRRSRMKDLRQYITLADLNLLRNLDYIHAMNCMWALIIHGPILKTIWSALRMLDSFEHFTRGANSLNQIAKKYKMDMQTRLLLAEMGGYTGYRQPPVPGFNMLDESRSLAEGGAPHGFGSAWEAQFTQSAREVMAKQIIPPVPYLTLRQYIESDLASTSGASSIGKLHWQSGDEVGKFKARKNLLRDMYTVDEILQMVEANYTHQTASAFVKPELGKMRIAVTGDIENYFVTSWLNYLCGHSYTSWEGNTLEESAEQQLLRMQTMLDELQDAMSIPFDYRGFDHQPTLDEVCIEAREYLQGAIYNTPMSERPIVSKYIDNTVESFRKTIMIVRDGPKLWKIVVTGGVQSGVRLTSLLGNFWNQIMTNIVKKTLAMPQFIKRQYLRGDDSAIFTQNYASALLFRLGYAAINAVGHDAKYGIHRQETEFLRIWYANDRVYGYPNRAIPSLTQRKPWTAEPWNGEATIRALIKTIRLLERRLARSLPKLLTIVTAAWVRKRKLDVEWLRLPESMGGIGVLPWQGYIADRRLPTAVPTVPIAFDVNPTTWAMYYASTKAILDKTMIPNEPPIWQAIQQEQLRGKVSTDDVPAVNRLTRQKYLSSMAEFLQGPKVQWRKLWISVRAQDSTEGITQLMTATKIQHLADRTPTPFFGQYARWRQQLDSLNVLSRHTDCHVYEEYAKYAPGFVSARKMLERAGLHRTMATDWLFGKYPRNTLTDTNEIFTAYIEATAATIIDSQITANPRSRYQWAYDMQEIWTHAERALKRSVVYRRLGLY